MLICKLKQNKQCNLRTKTYLLISGCTIFGQLTPTALPKFEVYLSSLTRRSFFMRFTLLASIINDFHSIGVYEYSLINNRLL